LKFRNNADFSVRDLKGYWIKDPHVINVLEIIVEELIGIQIKL